MVKFLKWLISLLEKDEEPTPDLVDYGSGYTARRLIDGRYAFEVDGEGLDLKHFGLTWPKEDFYWNECIADNLKSLDKVAKTIMASRGV